MENNNQNLPKEEINNIDHLKASPSESKNSEEPNEDEEYTAHEVEYADGEGTQLNDELGEIEDLEPNDIETEDDELDEENDSKV